VRQAALVGDHGAVGASDSDEIAGELYLVPPARFVAARDELVRKARAAGNPELARELHSLRRPKQSAWLVNLLTRHERASMERLFALGRDLRRAQTRLDATELRRLSAQRQQMIADLLDSARRQAADAGLRPTDGVLSEVEATLRAALVDLAASSTVLSGRLVQPMSHSGFGPMPHVDAAPALQTPPTGGPPAPAEAPALERPRTRASEHAASSEQEASPEWAFWPVDQAANSEQETSPEWSFWPVDDEVGRKRERTATERAARRRVERTRALADEPGERQAVAGGERVRHAEAELAAAESMHWQREQELADAEGALAAAQDRLEWLDSQRMEARREKVTAERRLTEARSAQRTAIRAVAKARRDLDAEESRLGQVPSEEPASEDPP